MTSITPMTWTTRLARAGRQARAFSIPLVAAGVLVAGCGTVHAPAAGAGGAGATSSGATAPSAAPSPSATPVPTTTGGTVVAGDPACTGWPSSAPHGRLTATFGAVAVERCVTGYQKGPGKVMWETATLEKSTKDITPLLTALLQPSTGRQPNTVCPDLAILPPEIVLISAAGKRLIPKIPVTGCGILETRVLGALSKLTWQPVSVRLVSKVTGVQPGTASVQPRSPKTFQTLPAA